GEPGRPVGGRRGRRRPQLLAVDLVVAVAAPGVEQPGGLPHRRLKEPGGGGKAPGTLADDLPAVLEYLVHGWWVVRQDTRFRFEGRLPSPRLAMPGSASIRPAVALAEPPTPGMPAPGWVPAPAK